MIIWFPLIAASLLIGFGLIFLFQDRFLAIFLGTKNSLTIKLGGIFWALLGLGMGLASFYLIQSSILYIGAILMIIDGLTFVFVPIDLLKQATLWTVENNWYRLIYIGFLILIGALIMIETLPYLV